MVGSWRVGISDFLKRIGAMNLDGHPSPCPLPARRGEGVRRTGEGDGSWRVGAAVGAGAVMLALVLLVGCGSRENRLAGARRELVLERLGAAIAQAAPGARVLFVGNPFARLAGAVSSIREADEAALRGLRRGLGTKALLAGAVAPALREGVAENPHAVAIPPGATTPLSFLTATGAWDRLIEATPRVDVLVSVIGLPVDLASTRAWTDPAGPRWALFLPDLRLLGGTTEVREAFENGRFLAVVLVRPGAPPEAQGMAADDAEEFDRRYVLITRENVETLVREWARWFP